LIRHLDELDDHSERTFGGVTTGSSRCSAKHDDEKEPIGTLAEHSPVGKEFCSIEHRHVGSCWGWTPSFPRFTNTECVPVFNDAA
jgi:hypothetical protein